MIDPTSNRRLIRARLDCRKPGYGAWLYVMNCEDRPDQVKVGFSVDPVGRAFGVRRRKRKRGTFLPIVEYGKQVSNALELERKTHELLKRYRVRGEWFRCSVSTATAAILRVAAAAGESGPSKARDEWIEEQAQAVVIIWRRDRYIPTVMRPRVDQLREEAREVFIGLPSAAGWIARGRQHSRAVYRTGFLSVPPDEQFFGGRAP